VKQEEKQDIAVTGLLLLLAFVFALGVIALIMMFVSTSKSDPWGGVPWPRHIEWTEYVVPDSGWVMCKPETDSTLTCIPLPPGVEVYVPHYVAGESDEARQSRIGRSILLTPGAVRDTLLLPKGGKH
jgi:hypothetical protein